MQNIDTTMSQNNNNNNRMKLTTLCERRNVDIDMIQRFIVHDGYDINERDGMNRSSIHWACENNNLLLVLLLVENNAMIDIIDIDGRTPLHYATKNHVNNIDIIQCLLEAGANIHQRDYNGRCSFYYACHYCNNVNVIELLLDHGAIIQNLYNRNNEYIQNDLLIITELNNNNPTNINFDNIRILLLRGFHFISIFHAVYNYNESIRDIIIENMLPDDIDVNNVDYHGNTPLHYAVILHADDNIRTLVQMKNVRINVTNNKGETPLFLAAKYHNSNLDQFTDIRSRNNDTSTIRLLLSFNASITIPDVDGTLPIQIAKLMGNEMNVYIIKVEEHNRLFHIFFYLKNEWSPLSSSLEYHNTNESNTNKQQKPRNQKSKAKKKGKVEVENQIKKQR